jgi:hypothetical protein
MTHEPNTTTPLLAELKMLFAQPPVLSTESELAYYSVMAKFLECFAPEDFMMKILVKDLTNETWEIMRLDRHKTLTIDRRYSQHLKFQKERKKLRDQRKEAIAQRAEKLANPPTAEERAFEAELHLVDVVGDVDEILERGPQELDHAKGLESGIEYYERLGQARDQAIKRRNEILELMSLYREGLGQSLRQVSERIIEGECKEIASEEAPLVSPAI